jgi:hypothetical protein
MKLPIYLAGGYVAKDFARDVASRLQHAEPTFAWWDSDQTDAVSVAMRERDAIDQAQRMFILDRDAGTGTSWEFGYWCGVHKCQPAELMPHRFVPIDGDWTGKLDWFGAPFAVTVAVRWNAQDIAGMIDDLSSYAMHGAQARVPARFLGDKP